MDSLHASVERHDLPLESPFGIARGTTSATSVVSVEVGVDQQGERESATGRGGSSGTDASTAATAATEARTGIGAASPSAYYDEDAASVEAALPDLLETLRTFDDPLPAPRGQNVASDAASPTLGTVEDALREARPDDAAARAAVSIALHDLATKRLRLPLYRLWGLDPTDVPPTSYTIGIAEPETMAERAAAAVRRGHDLLKVKLGTDADGARLRAVREAAPDAELRVDANGAWERDTALERLDLLAEHDVTLLEQPVPAPDLEALRIVTEHAPMPVAADEACVTTTDVGWVADACDVVVCKLMKCGGLATARRQIAEAREYDLDVLLGCMVESHASIAAAWHLAPTVDYVDLDGALLLAEDPYRGIPVEAGEAALSTLERPGTGARRRD